MTVHSCGRPCMWEICSKRFWYIIIGHNSAVFCHLQSFLNCKQQWQKATYYQQISSSLTVLMITDRKIINVCILHTHRTIAELYRGSGSGWPSRWRVSTKSPMGLLIEHSSKMSLPINCVMTKSCIKRLDCCWPWKHHTSTNCQCRPDNRFTTFISQNFKKLRTKFLMAKVTADSVFERLFNVIWCIQSSWREKHTETDHG